MQPLALPFFSHHQQTTLMANCRRFEVKVFGSIKLFMSKTKTHKRLKRTFEKITCRERSEREKRFVFPH